jgi:5-formaminoimidazole-4-carboxamide-1-beta-D-ribofuranosyl 5'-monophosphate synthetase
MEEQNLSQKPIQSFVAGFILYINFFSSFFVNSYIL